MRHHELYVEKLLIYQSSSSILQFVIDIIIEIVVVTGHLPHANFRTAYVLLALLAGFTSFKTLDSIRKDYFGLVHEDIQITFICELSLIVCDFWFLFGLDHHKDFIYVRLPFIILTFINLLIISFIMIKYQLFSLFYQGERTFKKPKTPGGTPDRGDVEMQDTNADTTAV